MRFNTSYELGVIAGSESRLVGLSAAKARVLASLRSARQSVTRPKSWLTLRAITRSSQLFFAIACLSSGAVGQSAQQQQAAADQRLREQREELDRVRREREQLEKQAAVLATTAHDLSDVVS